MHPTPQTGPASRFGSFRIVRGLAPSPVGARWLAVDDRTSDTAVVHTRPAADRKRRQAEFQAFESLAGTLPIPHLLPISGWGVWIGGPDGGERVAWVTPYTGTGAGIVTLRAHAVAKGGTLSPTEALEVARQVWDGVQAAHAGGRIGGPIDPDEVLIDPHGRVWIENHGLRRALGGSQGVEARVLRRMEVVSVAALAVELTTGLRDPMPRVQEWAARVEIPDVEIPESWSAKAEGWSEDALTAALTAALQARDAMPAVASVLRDALESMKGATDRVKEQAKETGKQAAKDAVASTLRAAVGGMIGSVLDALRGR
jgi:hypothetical protein